MEGIFSVFDYNTRGHVSGKEVADALYDENDKEFVMRVQKCPKGPAPVHCRDDLEPIVLDQEEERLKELMKDPTAKEDAKFTKVLEKCDNNLFIDEQNFFTKYNAFDKDHVSN